MQRERDKVEEEPEFLSTCHLYNYVQTQRYYRGTDPIFAVKGEKADKQGKGQNTKERQQQIPASSGANTSLRSCCGEQDCKKYLQIREYKIHTNIRGQNCKKHLQIRDYGIHTKIQVRIQHTYKDKSIWKQRVPWHWQPRQYIHR